MKIKTFKVERWMNEFEDDATCTPSQTFTKREYSQAVCPRFSLLQVSEWAGLQPVKNREIFDQWVNETEGVHYVKPVAGTTALVYYDKDIPFYDLCVRLIREKGLLFTPGECFEMEGCVRIGYAFDSKLLRQGLDKFAEFLKEN